MTLVCEDVVIIKTLSSNDNFFILKFFGKAFRQHKLLWCDPGPWWWHQSLVQIENHLDWLSAHLDQPIIEKGQKLNTDIQMSKMGCVRIVDFVCLFVCLSTLIVNDEFVKILQATPPPSSTCSAELACIAVVIQLLLQEAGPNYSLQTLWNRKDSVDLTLACEDSWGRSQPGPSNTHQFTMHSFGDALNQWRLHWCASGLWRYTA